ncbi:hypothetical protein BASA81_011130 [Batrachochytrium salamandrivorans]|nr:hypothetical protein BASA81_011130 [Batrachochytrium salamandrivorans]
MKNRLVSWIIRLVYGLGLEDWVLNVNVAKLLSRFVTSTTLTGGVAGHVQHCTLNVVVKTSSNSSVQGREQCRILQTWREAKFYQHLSGFAPTALEFLPQVFYSEYSETWGDFCLVMERVDGEVLTELLVMGAEEHSPLPLLRDLFTQLAVFHSSSPHPEQLLKENQWLKGADWYWGRGKLEYETKVNFAKQCWAQGKHTRGRLIPQLLLHRMDYALCEDEANFEKMVQHMQTTFLCLHHGDFHAGNVIKRPSTANQAFAFLDLSEIGVFDPTYDLAQFLISNVDGKWYEELLLPLVSAWHDKLDNPKPDEFTKEVAYQNLLLAGVNKWIYLLGILIGFPSVGDEKITYWADNLTKWIQLLERELGSPVLHRSFLKV